MSIALVVTAGFGNGTFNGTIPFVVTRGYTIGTAPPPPDNDALTAPLTFELTDDLTVLIS